MFKEIELWKHVDWLRATEEDENVTEDDERKCLVYSGIVAEGDENQLFNSSIETEKDGKQGLIDGGSAAEEGKRQEADKTQTLVDGGTMPEDTGSQALVDDGTVPEDAGSQAMVDGGTDGTLPENTGIQALVDVGNIEFLPEEIQRIIILIACRDDPSSRNRLALVNNFFYSLVIETRSMIYISENIRLPPNPISVRRLITHCLEKIAQCIARFGGKAEWMVCHSHCVLEKRAFKIINIQINRSA